MDELQSWNTLGNNKDDVVIQSPSFVGKFRGNASCAPTQINSFSQHKNEMVVKK
jgi:hypothetical protein